MQCKIKNRNVKNVQPLLPVDLIAPITHKLVQSIIFSLTCVLENKLEFACTLPYFYQNEKITLWSKTLYPSWQVKAEWLKEHVKCSISMIDKWFDKQIINFSKKTTFVHFSKKRTRIFSRRRKVKNVVRDYKTWKFTVIDCFFFVLVWSSR